MRPDVSTYFMDDEREAKRLSDKVDATVWVGKYLTPYLDSATHVLDVGCGPAVLAREVAVRCPDSNVVGLDVSKMRLAVAEQNRNGCSNLALRLGKATALPWHDASFDLVYCRFLLEYLADREKAVAEMVRVCSPGGQVILQDLDGQMLLHHPVDTELQSGIETALVALRKTGFDPFVGRKLFGLARDAGLINLKVEVEPYQLFAGRIDDHNYKLWELKLDIALPAIATTLGGEHAAYKFKQRFLDYLRRNDTLSYSTLFTVTGHIPGKGSARGTTPSV